MKRLLVTLGTCGLLVCCSMASARADGYDLYSWYHTENGDTNDSETYANGSAGNLTVVATVAGESTGSQLIGAEGVSSYVGGTVVDGEGDATSDCTFEAEGTPLDYDYNLSCAYQAISHASNNDSRCTGYGDGHAQSGDGALVIGNGTDNYFDSPFSNELINIAKILSGSHVGETYPTTNTDIRFQCHAFSDDGSAGVIQQADATAEIVIN